MEKLSKQELWKAMHSEHNLGECYECGTELIPYSMYPCPDDRHDRWCDNCKLGYVRHDAE